MSYLINDNLLAKAAFGLLSSSSVDRYERVASALAHQLEDDERYSSSEDNFKTSELIDKAERDWDYLLKCELREPAEFELAVILASLSSKSDRRIDALLHRIALVDRPPVTWLSSMARRILAGRPMNESDTLRGVDIDDIFAVVSPKVEEVDSQYEAGTSSWSLTSPDFIDSTLEPAA